jgi:mRNA-degrading endonuclease toxin of MazEF toxin-antitoxin module
MIAPISGPPQRGHVYLASVPFAVKNEELQTAVSAGNLESTRDLTGFVAAIRLKLRPVLVVQNNAITAQRGYEYVLIAPIYSVKEKHRSSPSFAQLLSNRFPQIFYLDRREQGVTRPSYVALAQIQLLHRSVLREYRGALGEDEMNQIDERLRFCLAL